MPAINKSTFDKTPLSSYLHEERIYRLFQKTRESFQSSELIAHNWDHIYRDIINSIWVGEVEEADMNIVLPAVIIHDIGFLYDRNHKVHHQVGAEKCVEWLTDWTTEETIAISSCIRTHKGGSLSFSEKPQTLEEKVVCDADSLEKTGHLGILQGAMVFTEFSTSDSKTYPELVEMAEFFSDIRPMEFFTKTGKELAHRRGNDMRAEFYTSALKQLNEYEIK